MEETMLIRCDGVLEQVEAGAELAEGCAIAAGFGDKVAFWWQDSLWAQLWEELITVLLSLVNAIPFLIGYVLLILLMMVIWRAIKRSMTPKRDFGSVSRP